MNMCAINRTNIILHENNKNQIVNNYQHFENNLY